MIQFKSAAKWVALAGAVALCAALFTSLAGSAIAHVPSDNEISTTTAPAPARPEFADIIETARGAVVTVAVEKTSGAQRLEYRGGDSRMDDFMRRFFDNPGMGQRGAPPMAPRGAPARGVGSGFIIDADEGYVVTNNHVIDGADRIVVTLDGGDEHEASVVGTDPKTDLALLRITANELEEVEFGDSDHARIGDWVVAIGNPFGLGGTATVGIISARGRDIQSGPYDDYIQIDAPINQGNSGGPVFDTRGRVIGVNTAIYSPNGGNVGIGFAIPARQVETIVDELAENGIVERGWLGVQLQPMSDDIAVSLGLDKASGALVVAVVPDSPAERGGIEVGDVIVDFDGRDVDSAKTLSRQVGSTPSGEKVAMKVWRDGSFQNVKVKLGEAERGQIAAAGNDAVNGMQLAELDDEMRTRLRIDEQISGVVVTSVDPGSAAASQGLRPGDLIVSVDRTGVSTPREVAQALVAAKRDDDSALLLVRRGDNQRFTTLPVG